MDPHAKIRALCETLALGEDDTLAADFTVRLEHPTAPIPARQAAALPIFDSVREGDRLQLGETIGEGGMGIVRRALQAALHRDVAVKTVQPGRASDSTNRSLLQEALVSGVLEHPNIVPIYALYQDERGAPLIVMKRVAGVSWRECTEDPSRVPDGIPDDVLGWHLQVLEDVCRAIHFAHSKGILHRDIKPDNVMIGAHGEVYVLDWGIAVTTDDGKSDFLPHVSHATGLAGTPAYMAPEMTLGEPGRLDPRTDVYLLGSTLYHVLSGTPPHDAPSVQSLLLSAYASQPEPLPADVPEELAAICAKAMARNHRERYPSAEAMRQAVQRFREHRSSIELSDRAMERLGELSRQEDLELARSLFAESRFGFEHAIAVWDDNVAARAGLRKAILRLLNLELEHGNLSAADPLYSLLKDPPASVSERMENLRAELQGREAELASLRSMERQASVTAGARYRTRGALVAWILLTAMPLIGQTVDRSIVTDLRTFFFHGVAVAIGLSLIVALLRKALFANEANRRIATIIIAFAISLPLLRYVAWKTQTTLLTALSVEAASYMVAYAALALLSQFTPWVGVIAYSVAAVAAVHFPDAVLYLTAAANFVAIGYVYLSYRRQATA